MTVEKQFFSPIQSILTTMFVFELIEFAHYKFQKFLRVLLKMKVCQHLLKRLLWTRQEGAPTMIRTLMLA